MRIHVRSPLCAVFAIAFLLSLASPTSAQKRVHPDTANLVDQCVHEGRLPSAAECGRWVARSQALEHAPCPDERGASACRSFRELLRSQDAVLINDLAHQDHVYVCFLPNVDEFFKVTYSDPVRSAFATPSPEQEKDGVPSAALTAPGSSDFVYYRNGVEDADSSFRDSGYWAYIALNAADPDTTRMNLNVREARFKSKHFTVNNDEWKMTDIYTSESGSQLAHTVAVQLATGRFRQEFALADSGKIQATNTGRCLSAPPAN